MNDHSPTGPARYIAEYETVHGTDRITVTRDGQQEPVFTAELPYDADRNAGQALARLGWQVVGMDAYAGPTFFRAVVEPCDPAVPRLMPDQARTAVTTTWPDANDFHPCHDGQGRFLGYTFASTATPAARFGWITNVGTYSKGLERHRSGAAQMLPAAVLDDERTAQRAETQAARRTLEGLRAARLTDNHDITEPTEEQQGVRVYVIDPRGHGRVALYWLEEGQVARRDTPQGFGALASLEDRLRVHGWTTEPMAQLAVPVRPRAPGQAPGVTPRRRGRPTPVTRRAGLPRLPNLTLQHHIATLCLSGRTRKPPPPPEDVMTTTTATAEYAPAQVGNGRTAHKTDAAAFSTETLCERTVSRVLTAEQAAKMKQCTKCAATEAATQTQAPAEVEETAPGEAPAVKEPEAPEGEQAPQAEEYAPAAPVEVSAYTAALEQLYCNGQDNPDRTLRVEAPAVPDTLAALRRMPRWNAAEERFTVNKVALILVRDVTGTRVWVRGEADPIRVDFTGAPVEQDVPAEGGPVDMAAIMAATRLLRRRREVQRVIDNRTAAQAWSAPAPVVDEPAPAPAQEVDEVEEPAQFGEPQWRTLKGVAAPFHLYGDNSGHHFRFAADRKVCTGEPLLITELRTERGARYGQDKTGRTISFGGTASRYWIATTA